MFRTRADEEAELRDVAEHAKMVERVFSELRLGSWVPEADSPGVKAAEPWRAWHSKDWLACAPDDWPTEANGEPVLPPYHGHRRVIERYMSMLSLWEGACANV